jgi:hypothetical protein
VPYTDEHNSLWRATTLKTRGELDHRISGRKMGVRTRYTRFTGLPISTLKGGGVAAGTTGAINHIIWPGTNALFEQFILGAGQTIITPTAVAGGGTLASLDLTNNEGAEYSNGVVDGFTIGTDAAFFARCRFKIADVSGTDQCMFGFRKAAAGAADHNDYTDKAVLDALSGDITILTALNNATDVSTDTTENWADGETHTFGVYVSAAGVVTYEIDGHAPATTAAFTFDTGDVVIPFFWFLHDATTPGAITLYEWEVDYQEYVTTPYTR